MVLCKKSKKQTGKTSSSSDSGGGEEEEAEQEELDELMDEEEYYEYGMANDSDEDNTYDDITDSSDNQFAGPSSGSGFG